MKFNLNSGSSSKLLKTTGVYMIGSMLSKVLNLVILPYISIQLSTDEYGVYDLIQTIVGVVLPIFTLQAIEAAFRFVYLEEKEKKGRVISNVWVIILTGSVLFLALLFLCDALFLHLGYAPLLAVYYVFNVLINMFQRVARCYDNNKVYSISGVIQTLVLLAVQYVFLRYLNLKTDGLVYAYAISSVVACVYIELNVKHIGKCSLKYLNKDDMKKIIRFSAPLIPNNISWWAISSVNRIVIVAFISYSANGIFSMSNKFASIVTMVASTFQLAWQEYGLTEKDNPDRRKTFSEVFRHFLIVLSCVTAGGMLLQQIFFNELIDPKYAESFLYIPIVMIGVAFSAINSFYGAGYFIYEKTNGAFKTTIVGALVSIALCFLLVKPLGLYGVSAAGAAAYGLMWLIRAITMRSYFRIDIRPSAVLFFVITIGASAAVYYMNNNIYSLIAIAVICGSFAVMYFKYFLAFVKKIRRG